jgi:hypothetical protein
VERWWETLSLYFSLTLAVLIAGCGAIPVLTEQQDAIQFNQRGETAFRRGDYAWLQEYQRWLSTGRWRTWQASLPNC